MGDMTRQLADGALDALALIEASAEDNETNRLSILTHSDLSLLLPGLVIVAASLRQSFAVASGITTEQVDAILRYMFIEAGDRASGGAE